MEKIATHNSATGEKSPWWLFWVIPFSKCQNKSIKEQFESGCRLFDIRIKLIGENWRCAHGLWFTSKTSTDIIKEINSFSEKCYVTLTYEGGYEHEKEFKKYIQFLKSMYKNIIFCSIAIKKGKTGNYDYLEKTDNPGKTESKFMVLDGHSWNTLLPIPWLWKKIYYDKVDFNDEYFTYIDFL